jgi:cyanophycinase-like exopeptidase
LEVSTVSELSLPEPGAILLFGSGETSPTGRKIFDHVFRSLPEKPRLALLETPAGFELNSAQVIGRVAEFFNHRFQNYSLQINILPARKRGTLDSPDNPEVVSPLLHADLIFMGPGSPSYAIRQLRDSLAWYYLVARHRLGSMLALASAATIAFSAFALPVYEIYKVGEDIHWIEGLDFFSRYGLKLVFIPHWNNNEGGVNLDTSRCFMGRERFLHLTEMLPEDITIIGLDEKTALLMDPSRCECQVKGIGSVTLIHTNHNHVQKGTIFSYGSLLTKDTDDKSNLARMVEQRAGHVHQYHAGEAFPMQDIGHFHPYHPEASLPTGIWQEAIQAYTAKPDESPPSPSDKVLELIRIRELARKNKNWQKADEIRKQVELMGWEILDTNTGPVSRVITSHRMKN